MKMPEFNVNDALRVDIRIKGVKELTFRLWLVKMLLHVASKIMHGDGCSVEMSSRKTEKISQQDPLYRMSYWLQQLEDNSASRVRDAERRFYIEEAKSEIFNLLRADQKE